MRICVIGTGYVGLVAGTCLSESGNDVVCVDSDEEKTGLLSRGTLTIYEPGLMELYERNLRGGRLSFTTDARAGVKGAGVIFIAVGTPMGQDGCVDMSGVWEAARAVGAAIEKGAVVVIKSTVPVGTAARVREIISGCGGRGFSVVSNPEFLKEGAAVADFMRPERVVVGAEPSDEHAREVMRELYAPFLRTGKPLLEMTNASAEVCKYACNGMLALKISYINEMAGFCEAVGADVNEVRTGMGTDPRIGPLFLFPGLGYGGSCLPKDVSALLKSAGEAGCRMDILRAVRDANERQKMLLVERAKRHFGSDLSGRRGAIWGLSFKPGTDDIRESPSITTILGLLGAGASLCVFDPVAMPNARTVLGGRVEYAGSDYEAARGADFLAIVTEWNEFRHPDVPRLKQLMRQPVILDGRNIYSRKRMENLGFTYYAVGC